VLHWVAEDDDRVLGELLCHHLRLPSNAGCERFLYSIGMRESEHRRGVGRALALDAQRGCPLRLGARGQPGAEEVPRGVRLERGGENDQGILMERPAVITDASP
jgi:hypothetical protein